MFFPQKGQVALFCPRPTRTLPPVRAPSACPSLPGDSARLDTAVASFDQGRSSQAGPGSQRTGGLQDPKIGRLINPDKKLGAVFGGSRQVSMFEITKLVSKHLS